MQMIENRGAMQSVRIHLWDWLLIVGAIVAPMTGWRIGKIGPAEVLCFVWALRFLREEVELNAYTIFFGVLVTCMFLGDIIGYIITPDETYFNLTVTWVYLGFVGSAMFKALRHNPLEYNIRVFSLISSLTVIWYALLYVYASHVSKTFLGAPLYYYSRYSGGGTNPHQVAVGLCGVAFWFIYQILQRKHVVRNAALFTLDLYLLSLTKSSTGIAALAVGVATLAVMLTIRHVPAGWKRWALFILEALVGVAVVLVFFGPLWDKFDAWVQSDSNGQGRFDLWSTFVPAFLKSPIFGLGTGAHAMNYNGTAIEFHSSYLDIFSAAGLVGFGALVAFMCYTAGKIIRGEMLLLPIMVCSYAYGIAGFAVRRLAFWTVMTFVTVLVIQMADRKMADREKEGGPAWNPNRIIRNS